SIANNLARDTARPAHSRSVKSSPLPPIRIPPGGVHGGLEASSQRLANLVARHEQAFAVLRARGMKLRLRGIGCVIAKAVFSEPSGSLRLQGLEQERLGAGRGVWQ